MKNIFWNVDPVMLKVGSFDIYWYGFFFALSLFFGYFIVRYFFKKDKVSTKYLDSIFLYITAGAIIGARMAHVIFYEPTYYYHNPLQIFSLWNGGLASHGGVIGIALSLLIFCKNNPEIRYLWILDRVSIPAALGGCLIRIGNFFNSEIVGVPSDKPWTIVFSKIDNLSRHPSQLYESAVYLTLFVFLITIYNKIKTRQDGFFVGTFFLLAFTSRFILEFTKTRQEDYDNLLPISVGQLLSIPGIALGIFILYSFSRKGLRT